MRRMASQHFEHTSLGGHIPRAYPQKHTAAGELLLEERRLIVR